LAKKGDPKSMVLDYETLELIDNYIALYRDIDLHHMRYKAAFLAGNQSAMVESRRRIERVRTR
jgi:hypothetical protein